MSGDGLVYHFSLSQHARFSDGGRLTAADAAASVAAVQHPGFPDAVLAGAWRGVSARAEGAATLTLTLTAARASFASTVAQLPIVPTSVAERPVDLLTRDATRPAPSSGPYAITAVHKDVLRLDANRWFGREPGLHSIELHLFPRFNLALQALAAGQVDALATSTPAERAVAARVASTRTYEMTSFRFVDLVLDSRRPGLDDPVVRRALGSAIDRRSIIAGPLRGSARAQMNAIPAGIRWVGGGGAAASAEPALAARALEAAGWRPLDPDGVRVRDGVRLAFTLSVPDAAPLPAVAGEVARELAAIGAKVTVLPVPVDRFATQVLATPTFDMAIADWDNGPDPDVSSFWRSNATPPTGFNVSGLPADPFLDRALDALATETDQALRLDAAHRVEQRLAEEVPAVFLYAPTTGLVVSSALRNVRLPPVGASEQRYDDIAEWSRG